VTTPRRLAILLLVFFGALTPVRAQQYAIGADVSFLAKCEQDGIVFKENGQPKDVLLMLREHHYNWVRLRLFQDPSTSAEKLPNDLNYTLALAKRAKAMGFHLLLDLHYSDRWADPGTQTPPAAWAKLKHKQLVEQVFNYTRDTIATFASAGVMPEMVQVGNEITNGILWPDGKLPNWANLADLLKAATSGIEAGRGALPRPRIMIHIDRGADYEVASWFFDTLIARHVPFDIIGLSFYPFSQGEVTKLRGTLHDLSVRFQHPIIVVETAYHWAPSDFKGKKADFPESPEGQKAFLQAVDAAVRAIPKGLGWGVFYWEPAAEHDLWQRSFFDGDGNVQPVITAFDQPAPH
jgi:arabinogalactan endo-1,4-beta-galactosidase